MCIICYKSPIIRIIAKVISEGATEGVLEKRLVMIPIDSTNDQNICVELFKATFTH